MTEEEAQCWLRDTLGVSIEVNARLETFVDFLLERALTQNLISDSTRQQVWARHIVDSAQLVPLARGASLGAWLDIGSGAGLPGIVTALITGRATTLVEPRALRVAFLREALARMGLTNTVTITPTRLEVCPTAHFTVISARAFAPLSRVFDVSHRFSSPDTLWLLPKGANAGNDVADARRRWRGTFHVEQSITEPNSGIVVATRVMWR